MQKDSPNDEELSFKKRARRRLVGAIALVLLMIIVLPMILKDRTVTQPSDEITITLPNENQLADTAESTQAEPETMPSDFDSNIVAADQVPTETLRSDAELNDAEAETLADKSVDSEAAIAEKNIAKSTEAKKPLELKPESPNQYYVQVGVFSDAANVKQLQSKLSDLGYKSQTEKISTDKGQKIRLRTHTFGDRNEAAIALENIKDAGLTGMVVSQ